MPRTPQQRAAAFLLREDAQPLRNAAQEYVDYLASDDYNEDGVSEYENAVFEAALELVFGSDVWAFVHEVMK